MTTTFDETMKTFIIYGIVLVLIQKNLGKNLETNGNALNRVQPNKQDDNTYERNVSDSEFENGTLGHETEVLDLTTTVASSLKTVAVDVSKQEYLKKNGSRKNVTVDEIFQDDGAVKVNGDNNRNDVKSIVDNETENFVIKDSKQSYAIGNNDFNKTRNGIADKSSGILLNGSTNTIDQNFNSSDSQSLNEPKNLKNLNYLQNLNTNNDSKNLNDSQNNSQNSSKDLHLLKDSPQLNPRKKYVNKNLDYLKLTQFTKSNRNKPINFNKKIKILKNLDADDYLLKSLDSKETVKSANLDIDPDPKLTNASQVVQIQENSTDPTEQEKVQSTENPVESPAPSLVEPIKYPNDLEWDNFVNEEESKDDLTNNHTLPMNMKRRTSKLETQITCYSCSGDKDKCLYVNEKTQTCKTSYACLYIVESEEKVTRHCFIPMPEHKILFPEQVCKNMHDVYYECASCKTNFCNSKTHDRFGPVIIGGKNANQEFLNDLIKFNETDDEKQRSGGSSLVTAQLLFCVFVVVIEI